MERNSRRMSELLEGHVTYFLGFGSTVSSAEIDAARTLLATVYHRGEKRGPYQDLDCPLLSPAKKARMQSKETS
jgi:hypothetical protein